MMNKRKSLLIAVAITLVFACIILLLFYPSGSPLGSFFDVLFVLIVIHYMAIVYGVFVFLLRALGFLKDNSALIYVFAGTFNIFLFIVGISLFLAGWANIEWLHKSIVNLFIGFIILTDMFVYHQETRK